MSPAAVPEPDSSRARRRAARVLFASALALLVATLGGCGEKEEPELASGPGLDLVQLARSGSFMAVGGAGGGGGGEGRELDLILRRVGGSSSLAVPGEESPGATVSTAKLFEDARGLLGTGPFPAELRGAELNPLAISLRLRSPRYDGKTGTVRWRAEVVDGSPEGLPGSFGAARLVVDLPEATPSITGEVRSTAGGAALADALVTLRADGLGLVTTRTDPGGTFELGPLPAATEYRIDVSKPGFEQASIDLDPTSGERPVVELAPSAGAPSG